MPVNFLPLLFYLGVQDIRLLIATDGRSVREVGERK